MDVAVGCILGEPKVGENMIERNEYEVFDLGQRLLELCKADANERDLQSMRFGAIVALNWMLGIFGNTEIAKMLQLARTPTLENDTAETGDNPD